MARHNLKYKLRTKCNKDVKNTVKACVLYFLKIHYTSDLIT